MSEEVLTLAQKIRVAVALNPGVHLILPRDEALMIVHALEHKERIDAAVRKIGDLKADFDSRVDRIDGHYRLALGKLLLVTLVAWSGLIWVVLS